MSGPAIHPGSLAHSTRPGDREMFKYLDTGISVDPCNGGPVFPSSNQGSECRNLSTNRMPGVQSKSLENKYTEEKLSTKFSIPENNCLDNLVIMLKFLKANGNMILEHISECPTSNYFDIRGRGLKNDFCPTIHEDALLSNLFAQF